METKEITILAEEISKIAKGFETLLSSGLKHEAIVALLQTMPGTNRMSKKKILAVLANLRGLKDQFINNEQLSAKISIRNLKK